MRKFGLELEYSNRNLTNDVLTAALRESVETHDPSHRVSTQETFRHWTVKGDSSCGHEITSPALISEPENFNRLKNVVDTLRTKIRGQRAVNRSCGLHVHFEISEFTNDQIKNLLKIFYAFEEALLKLNPPSRTNNSYCRTFHQQNSNPDWINTFDPDQTDYNRTYFVFDHFTGLNLGRFLNRGTIEIRYGASTLRGVKVINWTKLLLTLVELSKQNVTIPNRTVNITDLIAFINAHNTNIEWLDQHKRRITRWMGNRVQELAVPIRERRRARADNNRTTNVGSNIEMPRVDQYEEIS
jgi:hypothetical protein